ncbi:MAG: CheR family methyltransferase [Thermodesulfovibrionales bacterium]
MGRPDTDHEGRTGREGPLRERGITTGGTAAVDTHKKMKMGTPGAKKGKAKKQSPAVRKKAVAPAPPEKKAAADVREKSPAPGKDFFVVGIGSSAGGLEALEHFFLNMPPDSGMAFVLVSHLDPSHKSILPELLKRYTKMSIFETKDGMEVRPDCVYIIPPNKDMAILHGKLHLFVPVESRGLRHPIDFFFRALAQDQREKAVAVVLSGTGTEGALGIRAIKGEDGLLVVQDPKDAKYDGMPASSIATGLVDFVLPAAKIPEQLLGFISRIIKRPLRPVDGPEEQRIDPLQKIFVLIRAKTGNDFSLYKQSTILRRIEKRTVIHQIKGLTDYVSYLRHNPQEIDVLFKELLIRVTNFFRDSDAFDAVRKEALPLITRDKSFENPLRVWVPGCSTGEEAYSLAILIREYMQKANLDFKAQIFGTDIDAEAIDTARTGAYAENITVDVSPERLSRYFTRKGNVYKVKDEIREMIIFSVQNVTKDPPFSRLDLISCRNLLIYLNSALQKRVLSTFSYALNPEGVLFLGPSETIGVATDLFSVIDRKWKIFKALKTGLPLPIGLKALPAVKKILPEKITAAKLPVEPGFSDLAERLILEKYAPPCVIVNDRGDILYIHGRTGNYLEPPAGKAAQMNVLEMAREGLRLELRAALREAARKKKEMRIGGVQVKTNGSFHIIDFEVTPVKRPEALTSLFTVVFREVKVHEKEKAGRRQKRMKTQDSRRIDELEFELKATRERLQTTIEELETANEELKSANEELQSANEEFQSTNEELETSREELQSVNEELITMNAEYQGKIDELSKAYDDLRNLTASTQIATLFLDNDLAIKNFTPPIKDIVNLLESDIGRPITDFTFKVEYPELTADVKRVLDTLAMKEVPMRHQDGRWYLTRIIPYRTSGNMIAGAIVTFIDVTEHKKMQALQDALAFSEGIYETISEPLVVLDKDLSVISANRAFYSIFKTSSGEAENKPIFELDEGHWNIPELKEMLQKIFSENIPFKDFVVEADIPKIGPMKMLLNARRITHRGIGTEMVLLVVNKVDRGRS